MLFLSVIQQLDLQVYRHEVGVLADGSRRTFNVYRGSVICDGERRSVDCNASEAYSLIGMSLLYGYRMQINVIEGSRVTISKLPS